MKQSVKDYKIAYLLVISLSLVLYTYFMIVDFSANVIDVENVSSINRPALCLLVIEMFSLVGVFYHSNNRHTPLYSTFIIWVVWIFIVFFIFGLRGTGISNIILALPCPFVFFYYYNITNTEKKERIIIFTFIIIFLISGNFCVSSLFLYRAVYTGDDPFISNLIFWPLCTVPFVFLVEKKWQKLTLLILFSLLVLLTAKRSATICLILIVISYAIYNIRMVRKNKKNNTSLIIGLVFLGIVSYYVINKYFSSEIIVITDRFSTVGEDKGTGRIPIYQNILNHLGQFSFDEYLIGRGYSSIRTTGHTNAHNDALQMLFEYGLFGLLYYLLITIYAFKRLFYVRKYLTHYYPGYLASINIYIVLGMVSNLFAYNTYFMFICAYWGYVEGIINRKKY